MRNLRADLIGFNATFGLPIGDRDMDEEWLLFRHRFLREEVDEFMAGIVLNSHNDMLDALVDIIYVAVGTAVTLGYPLEEAWDRVHNANLKKVRAKDSSESKRGHGMDLIKPLGWEAPNFEDIL